MTALVARARQDGDRIGEFAAMYSVVTRRVRYLAGQGAFGDADRMAVFVARFAARFLDAVTAAQARTPVTQSWAVCFSAAGQWRPIILQHLLAGMNAHIGLDLGVVAAELASAPGSAGLEAMRPDFDGINSVLAALVPQVEAAVGQLSPAIGLLDKAGGTADALAVSKVIATARDIAWHSATELTPLSGGARVSAIRRIDGEVAELGHRIVHPGPLASSVLLRIRLTERRSVAEAIDVLGSIDVTT